MYMSRFKKQQPHIAGIQLYITKFCQIRPCILGEMFYWEVLLRCSTSHLVIDMEAIAKGVVLVDYITQCKIALALIFDSGQTLILDELKCFTLISITKTRLSAGPKLARFREFGLLISYRFYTWFNKWNRIILWHHLFMIIASSNPAKYLPHTHTLHQLKQIHEIAESNSNNLSCLNLHVHPSVPSVIILTLDDVGCKISQFFSSKMSHFTTIFGITMQNTFK